jgi:hypothetical protein
MAQRWTDKQKQTLFDGVEKYGFDWPRITEELRAVGYTKSVDNVAKYYFSTRATYKKPTNEIEIFARSKPWV